MLNAQKNDNNTGAQTRPVWSDQHLYCPKGRMLAPVRHKTPFLSIGARKVTNRTYNNNKKISCRGNGGGSLVTDRTGLATEMNVTKSSILYY